MTAQFQQHPLGAGPILEELEGAQQQYVDVLGTDDRSSPVLVERIRKDLLAAETGISTRFSLSLCRGARQASAIGLRHYDVQMLGMVLNSGRIAEMKTGEGKHWLPPCRSI